jgi:hypothetical protein
MKKIIISIGVAVILLTGQVFASVRGNVDTNPATVIAENF